jgi:competence protein ComEC
VIRRALTFGWPTVLVGAVCAGIVSANVLRVSSGVALALVGTALAAALVVDGRTRIALVAAVLLVAGAWWGALRLGALEQSVLAREIGHTAHARVVVTGPARRGRYSLRIPAEVREFAGRSMREAVLLELPDARAPPQGAVLELRVRPLAPRGPETGFDERGWLSRRGVHVVVRGTDAHVVGRRGGIGGVADRLRGGVAHGQARGSGGERRALLAGIVLGDDDGLDDRTRAAFKASGLYHLLAVSGQNIAFIAGGVLGLCWVLGISRLAAHVAVLAAIGAYTLAVGWQPSVVRASVAGALASLAWLASRPRDRWHFLALGALVLLAWNPATIFDAGFQLSFAAVAGIFLWVPRLNRALLRLPLPFELPPLVRGIVSVSIVCGTVTSPILWLDFHRVPVWGVLANALAEPAVGPLLGLGLAAALIAPFSPGAATALSWLAGWCAAWIAFAARLVAGLPGAEASSGAVLLIALGAVASVLVVVRLPAWRRRGVLVVMAALWFLVLTTTYALAPSSTWTPPAGLRVTFLDVGQGDAELLEVPEGGILVDTGPPEAHVDRQLRGLGVTSLSIVTVTHPHRDHVGGAADVLRHVRVGEVLDPLQPEPAGSEADMLAAARALAVPVRPARRGQTIGLGKLTLAVLWPDSGGLAGQDPHLHGVVLLASYGATDILFTGDAESNVTMQLPLRPVEVLKVAHHGSADPGLRELLGRLRPEVAMIEVGRGNDYGHPRDATLAALAASPGLRLFRTDLNGRVVLETDGRRISVRADRGVGSVRVLADAAPARLPPDRERSTEDRARRLALAAPLRTGGRRAPLRARSFRRGGSLTLQRGQPVRRRQARRRRGGRRAPKRRRPADGRVEGRRCGRRRRVPRVTGARDHACARRRGDPKGCAAREGVPEGG